MNKHFASFNLQTLFLLLKEDEKTCISSQKRLDHPVLMTSCLVTIVTDHHWTCLKMRARDKRTATENVGCWCFSSRKKLTRHWFKIYTLTTVHPSVDCWWTKDCTYLMCTFFHPRINMPVRIIMPVLQQIRLTQVAKKVRKLESSPAICNKSVHASCCAYYRSKWKANLLCNKLHSSRVWCNPSVIFEVSIQYNLDQLVTS